MAELSLRQIEDRLNAEFAGEGRRLIFWYDDRGDFSEDIGALELACAKVYRLEPDNQFYTKYFLERVDRETSYLVYAPFPKPDAEDNHLEDTLLYSKRFYADRAALLCADLGIGEEHRWLIEKHSRLFNNKKFVQRFYNLEIDRFDTETILTGLLCAACQTRACSFDEVVCALLMEDLERNPCLEKLYAQGLADTFWEFCGQQFGYTEEAPSLERFVTALFVTCADRYMRGGLPEAWRPFLTSRPGSVVAFMDNLMNSAVCRGRFDQLSAYVSKELGAAAALAACPPESLLNCDTFLDVDRVLIRWLVDRLLAEDVGARLDGSSIPEICGRRSRLRFGTQTETAYRLLENAHRLVLSAGYSGPDSFAGIAEQYLAGDYLIDQAYRKFYLCYDRMDGPEVFEPLRELVENIYTAEYLAGQLPRWNGGMLEPEALAVLPRQRDFYRRFVKSTGERTVVIISDAMRYEVGRELFEKLRDEPRCASAKLEAMLGVLPSYTHLGMASLLPHSTLEMTETYQVLADGKRCDDMESRQKILLSGCPEGVCVRFDDIKTLKKESLREILTGKQVVYVYHNQIDARGETAQTENEVFAACEEAVREIMALIQRISINGNTYRFLITADHGFIYKREKLAESDKISGVGGKGGFLNRRFIVSGEPVTGGGIQNFPLGWFLDNGESRSISVPLGGNVFQAPGGLNYVHGGSSPQEMLIPVLDIKMERGHVETKAAELSLISIVRKITSLVTTLDFLQTEPVSDTVKPAVYKIFFLSERGDRISNENIHAADSREQETQRRIFRLRFTFKNQRYHRDQQYYLVVCDAATGAEIFRHSVIMDLAAADDFGFGF